METASGDFFVVTHPYTVSGDFINREQNELMHTSKLIQQRAIIEQKFSEVEAKLRSCNDPTRLSELALWCFTKRNDFGQTLTKIAAKLEIEKSKLETKLGEIDQQTGVPVAKMLDSPNITGSLIPRVHRVQNDCIAKRHEVIDANLDKNTLEICRILDRILADHKGDASEYAPEGWERDFGVRTFVEAYMNMRCRNRVEKMISVRRRANRYPIY